MQARSAILRGRVEAWLNEEVNDGEELRGDSLRRNSWALDFTWKAWQARAALSADGGDVEARSKTVHRRIDQLCQAANTPDADYFDASTNMLIATRELLTTIGHPHAMDIAASTAKGDA